MYPRQLQRFEEIRAATLTRLAAAAGDLAGLDDDALADRLIQEALARFYDDEARRNLEWEYVDRTVRRAMSDYRRRDDAAGDTDVGGGDDASAG